MTLSRDFKLSAITRVERNRAFAKSMLDVAATLSLSGESPMGVEALIFAAAFVFGLSSRRVT